MNITMVPVGDLNPAIYNPRQASKEEYDQLKTSLERFGFVDPIIVNSHESRKNTVIGGHFRLRVAKDMGMAEVPVHYIEIAEEEREKELNLRLNKNSGSWDEALLATFDSSLLLDVGFDSKMVDMLSGSLEPKPEDDEVPEVPEEPKSKLGDIYQLGQHRVMCGDSTKVEDVERLMDGKLSDMIHTDPPYNVDYGSSKNPQHKIRQIENDKMDAVSWEDFCKSLFANFKLFNKGDVYMWGASGPEGMRMRLWLVELGCHWSATIIWKKDRFVLTPANYQRMYEPCFYGWFDKSTYDGGRKEVEVWDMKRPHDSKLHPTMKPIEVCSRAISNSSKADDIVLDLFLGSGSTLIAAEKTGRICYGMELSESYCDVIIERWEKYTGQKAEKL